MSLNEQQKTMVNFLMKRLSGYVGKKITPDLVEELTEDLHEYVSEFLENSLEDDEGEEE